jgi:hypothetical protein
MAGKGSDWKWCADIPGCEALSVCLAKSDADCAASEACKAWGRCSLVGGHCAAKSEADCQQSQACQQEGRCELQRGQCCRQEFSRYACAGP